LFSIGGPNALKTDDPFLVDNKVGPPWKAFCFIKYTKGLHNLLILKIAEKGVIQLHKIRKRLLGKAGVGAYA
jgi:hypothetical protein